MNLKPGTRISEYRLVEVLGEGGFGQVWKAEHIELPNKYVAIKFPTHPEFIEYLRREAVSQYHLRHPHVVRTLGLDSRHDPPYLIMEYVEGRNLRAVLQEDGIIPPANAVDMTIQILGALEFAHRQGIVHRDIKPENILVERRPVVDGLAKKKTIKGYTYFARLTDMGLGQFQEQCDSQILISASMRNKEGQSIFGSVHYMSPEQMCPGERETDGRSDVYAVGVVLHEMLTGELPLGMDLPSELNPIVPKPLDRVIKKALAVDRDNRYPSAQVMARDLWAVLDHLRAHNSNTRASTVSTAPSPSPAALPHRASAPATATPSRKKKGLRGLFGRAGKSIRRKKSKGKWKWGLTETSITSVGFALIAVIGFLIWDTWQTNAVPTAADTVDYAGAMTFDENGVWEVPVVVDSPDATIKINGDVWNADQPFGLKQQDPVSLYVSAPYHYPLDGTYVLQPGADGSGRFVAERVSGHGKVWIDGSTGVPHLAIALEREKGTLSLTTEPEGAEVVIDGEVVGTTPYLGEEMRAGPYSILLRHSDAGEVRLEANLTAAGIERHISLKSVSQSDSAYGDGLVSVRCANVEAVLRVDGNTVGTTPIVKARIPAGMHSFELTASGYEAHAWSGEIHADEAIAFEFALSPKKFPVRIETVPEGATIRVDGEELGSSPVSLDTLEAGTHAVEIEAVGYKTLKTTIDVDRTSSEPFRFALSSSAGGDLHIVTPLPETPIYVDGVAMGKGKLQLASLAVGPHVVRILDRVWSVQLDEGLKKVLNITMDDFGLIRHGAGAFHRGSEDGFPSEQPVQEVKLAEFWVQSNEVTRKQYARFLHWLSTGGDHSFCHPAEPVSKNHAPDDWDHVVGDKNAALPVTGVDWYDAYAYSRWAGMRLATEAEWERVARGADDHVYPWGNQFDQRRGNFNDQGQVDSYEAAAPVGKFERGATPAGVNDLAGNVREWCENVYSSTEYAGGIAVNPMGPEKGPFRAVRGGSFKTPNTFMKSYSRSYEFPLARDNDLGFRCVLAR